MKIALMPACILVIAILGCAPAKPQVICVMRNPNTGAQVERYQEIRSKVPADYDQQKHIAQWKTEQMKKGYTVDIQF